MAGNYRVGFYVVNDLEFNGHEITVFVLNREFIDAIKLRTNIANF